MKPTQGVEVRSNRTVDSSSVGYSLYLAMDNRDKLASESSGSMEEATEEPQSTATTNETGTLSGQVQTERKSTSASATAEQKRLLSI